MAAGRQFHEHRQAIGMHGRRGWWVAGRVRRAQLALAAAPVVVRQRLLKLLLLVRLVARLLLLQRLLLPAWGVPTAAGMGRAESGQHSVPKGGGEDGNAKQGPQHSTLQRGQGYKAAAPRLPNPSWPSRTVPAPFLAPTAIPAQGRRPGAAAAALHASLVQQLPLLLRPLRLRLRLGRRRLRRILLHGLGPGSSGGGGGLGAAVGCGGLASGRSRLWRLLAQ